MCVADGRAGDVPIDALQRRCVASPSGKDLTHSPLIVFGPYCSLKGNPT